MLKKLLAISTIVWISYLSVRGRYINANQVTAGPIKSYRVFLFNVITIVLAEYASGHDRQVHSCLPKHASFCLCFRKHETRKRPIPPYPPTLQLASSLLGTQPSPDHHVLPSFSHSEISLSLALGRLASISFWPAHLTNLKRIYAPPLRFFSIASLSIM